MVGHRIVTLLTHSVRMKTEWILTKESFDALLAWLDTNPDAAARKYEQIRARLIKIFLCRGCLESEDLADETIDRVARRLNDIEATFTGDPARYFYGVANKIHLEYLRRKPMPRPPVSVDDTEQDSREYECLERCMQQLSPKNRELVLEYYQEERWAKIDHRKRLADQLGIALNALRIRACRIRASLLECVKNCVHTAAE
jgi:DNA-directed RNA polymerase specialized sigma24 family protein